MATFLPIFREDVIAFAPQLTTVTLDAWTLILTYVNEYDLAQLKETESSVRMARILLAAHMGQMLKDARKGAAGPLTGESLGDARRSYGLVAMSSGSSLQSTKYGQLFSDTIAMTVANGPMLI